MNLYERIRVLVDELPADRRRSLRDVNVKSSEPGCLQIGDQEVVDFASNDYLGLSRHPILCERSAEWTRNHGAGSRASRLVSGNLAGFSELEKKLAELKGSESALIFGSGFQANSSVLAALLDRRLQAAGEDEQTSRSTQVQVFSDRLCHASFHFGFAAAGVRQHRFHHNDLEHLKQLLDQHASSDSGLLIATESVFSMDGDRLDVAAIRSLAKQYQAMLVVDEAHATGVLGKSGMGLMPDGLEQVTSECENEIVIGTFGKALGSYGSYVACSELVREYLINRCSGLIYSTALPPPVLGAIDAALDLIPSLETERAHLRQLADHFRQAMHARGLDTLDSTTQIVPVILGNDGKVMETAASLLAAGFLVAAIRPPTVPPGTARLRISLSAAHSFDQVTALATAIIRLVRLP